MQMRKLMFREINDLPKSSSKEEAEPRLSDPDPDVNVAAVGCHLPPPTLHSSQAHPRCCFGKGTILESWH